MDTLVTIIHVVVCVFLVLVVLLQAGKGGGMGIAFGGAGSQTVFGGSGAGNFLTKLTVLSAFGFMVTSMTLAYFSSHQGVDPLKQLSVQSREAAEQREQLKQEIESGAVAPDAENAPPLTGEEARELLDEELGGASSPEGEAVPAGDSAEANEAAEPAGIEPAGEDAVGQPEATPPAPAPAEANEPTGPPAAADDDSE